MALLNLTNFDDHPTDPHWLVFRFGDREMADEFMAGLREADIAFEADLDGDMALVAVKQRHREAAIRIDYAVLGRHRQPFIGDGWLRWGLLAFTLLLVLLALVGAWLG
ncbi:MAG: hypothetical protein KIT10_06595 [Flavobacteriales bacterium]|nr:hypothetical protein [Flavobacteriales bacterium]